MINFNDILGLVISMSCWSHLEAREISPAHLVAAASRSRLKECTVDSRVIGSLKQITRSRKVG